MKRPEEEYEYHHRHAGHGERYGEEEGRHESHGGGNRRGTRRDHVVISTVVVGVALFLFVGTPYLKHHLPPESAVVNAIGADAVTGDRESDRGFDRRSDRDRDREAVRRWLRENDDDPNPQEIRWWPPREVARLHREHLERAADEARGDSGDPARPDDRICRLKYRERDARGGETVRDDLFLLRDGKVRLVAKDSSLAIAARQALTDGESVR